MRSSKTIGPASTRKRQTGGRPSAQSCRFWASESSPALPQVARHHPPGDERGPLGLQLLFGAVAGIDLPLGDQALETVAVEIEALGLVIGAIRASRLRPLVPVDPQPLQLLEEILLEGLGRPGPVGILDAQDKDAAVMPGVKPVEERRPRVADVEFPRRRGGKSNPDPGSIMMRLPRQEKRRQRRRRPPRPPRAPSPRSSWP